MILDLLSGGGSSEGSGFVGGTFGSGVATNRLFITCSTITGIPDDLEPSIFSLRKAHPAISTTRLVSSSSSLVLMSRSNFTLVAAAVLASSLEPPYSMLLK